MKVSPRGQEGEEGAAVERGGGRGRMGVCVALRVDRLDKLKDEPAE